MKAALLILKSKKLKTSYELYVTEYGFAIDYLEGLSPFDLWAASRNLNGITIVNDEQEARELIARLKDGATFTKVREAYNVLPKTRAEHVVEDIKVALIFSRLSRKQK